jgi:hypothetical protein
MLAPVTQVNSGSNAIRPQAAATDIGAGHTPVVLPQLPVDGGAADLDLGGGAIFSQINAETATAGGRTVIQSLAETIANVINIVRRDDETLNALYLRIADAIDTMNPVDQLMAEMRSGLRALKIPLPALAAALRNPDGPIAARVAAAAEAPFAPANSAPAEAATDTYLGGGENTSHAAETLAMRTAARNNAAGNGIFSATPTNKQTERPADAKILQQQLQTLFEPGADQSVAREETEVPAEKTTASPKSADVNHAAEPEDHKDMEIQSSNMAQTQRLRATVKDIVQEKLGDKLPTEANGAGDRRLETMLTLKGLSEAIANLPDRGAEIASILARNAASSAEHLASQHALNPNADSRDPNHSGDNRSTNRTDANGMRNDLTGPQSFAEALRADDDVEVPHKAVAKAENPDGQNGAKTVDQERSALQNGLAHGEAIPFALGQAGPARDKFRVERKDDDDDRRRRQQSEGDDTLEDDGQSEKQARRPRDEYDAIHDETPEEDGLKITRDSSDSDRAFALYQRMGGF